MESHSDTPLLWILWGLTLLGLLFYVTLLLAPYDAQVALFLAWAPFALFAMLVLSGLFDFILVVFARRCKDKTLTHLFLATGLLNTMAVLDLFCQTHG